MTGGPAFWGASPVAPPCRSSDPARIDNDAGTWITRSGGDPRELDYLRFEWSRSRRRCGRAAAAIIGVGGGRDVLTAASFGFTRIVGIEVNPAIVDLVQRRFGDFSGFASIPALELHVDEGRSFLTRSSETFDLVQATLVDTWAGTAAGAMALTENSLYTVEPGGSSAGISCGATCATTYTAETAVTLTATAAAGSTSRGGGRLQRHGRMRCHDERAAGRRQRTSTSCNIRCRSRRPALAAGR